MKENLHIYNGYAIEDDTVQRYLLQWRQDKRTSNLVGDVCGDYQGYGMSMRFVGLNIPAKAVIQKAHLIMTFVIETASDGLEGTRSSLRCEDSYNPASISSYEDHIDRPRTQEHYRWIGLLGHTVDIEVQSPDFKSSVQEVVNKHNGTGDALTVFWEDPDRESNDGRHRCVASVEHPIHPPAKLHIEYLAEGEPTELVEKRTETSKLYDLGENKRSLDCHIGAIHYKDNYADPREQWKDIDLTWEGNRITKAPYELTLEGNKATVKDKKTGEISTIELLEIGGIPIPPQVWERSRGLAKAFATDLEVVAGNGSVSFARILKSDQVAVEAKYRVTGNIPLRVKASDTEDELPVEWTVTDGILTETLKPDRPVKYPVRIDPTLDPQVGASEDDAHQKESTGAMTIDGTSVNTVSSSYAASRYWGGFRFVSGSFPALGTTIDVAYLRVYVYSTGYDDANFDIHFEELAAPAAFTTGGGDISGRDRTEASVEWIADAIRAGGSGFYNSPSLCGVASPIQEVFDAYSPTTMVVITKPKTDIDKSLYVYAWDYNDNTRGAILHLEWTVGGETYEESCSDGLKVGDSNIQNLVLDLVVTDGLKGGESTEQPLTIPKSLADGVKIGDTPLPDWIFNPAITDGLKLGEALSTLLESYPALTDGLKAGDTPDTIAILNALVSDGVKLGDATSIAGAIYELLVADGLKLSDTTKAGLVFALTLADGIKLSDTIKVGLVYQLLLSDGITFSEALSATRIIRRIRKRIPDYTLGRVKATAYSLGRSLKRYTLGG